jgi:hypothetical protein
LKQQQATLNRLTVAWQNGEESGIGREQYWCSTAFQRPRRTHKQCLEKSKDRLSINLTV